MYIFTFKIFIKPFEYENQNFKLIFFLFPGLGREGLTAFETLKSDIKILDRCFLALQIHFDGQVTSMLS